MVTWHSPQMWSRHVDYLIVTRSLHKHNCETLPPQGWIPSCHSTRPQCETVKGSCTGYQRWERTNVKNTVPQGHWIHHVCVDRDVSRHHLCCSPPQPILVQPWEGTLDSCTIHYLIPQCHKRIKTCVGRKTTNKTHQIHEHGLGIIYRHSQVCLGLYLLTQKWHNLMELPRCKAQTRTWAAWGLYAPRPQNIMQVLSPAKASFPHFNCCSNLPHTPYVKSGHL